ncbi:MAG TPA: response regulator [Acetobacteraceae bacterium]|jgi:CheY-like chemotaxis protein
MAPNTSLEGLRILVVEDDYLVAQIVCAMLEDAGATIVGPIGWAREALAFIETGATPFDRAILDIDLHGVKSYPLADALARRNIRFAFATGYGGGALDPAYREFPRCEKPFNERALIGVLA